MRIELQLLGRFAAMAPGPPPAAIAIPSGKCRALLAYLAMQPGHAETRERLADLLWGDRRDKQARQSLRQSLLTLRKDLEPIAPDLLAVERDSVSLRAALIAVDVHEFERLANSGSADDVERAAGLYRGELFAGGDVDTEAFGHWLTLERARLRALAARVFESYAAMHDKAGGGPRALWAAERLVALDPLQEGWQRILLRLQARHRGREAALAHAKNVSALLRRELDVEPEPATTALIEEIARGAIAPVTPTPAVGWKPPPMPDAAVAATESAAPPHVASSRPGLWRPALAMASIAALIALGGAAALLMDRDRPAAVAPIETPREGAGNGTGAAGESWRSPGILPNVAVDGAGMAGQYLYAVVVLPFTADAAAGSREQGLADRITDNLTNDLSRVPAIRVISRQTARLYRGRAVDVAAVGAELGVRYVIEGDVRLEGAQLHVNVALTDPASRLQLWSDRLTRDAADSAALQDEITRGIARRLQINVVAMEDRRRPPGAGDPGIDGLLAKGWAAVTRISEADKASGADGYFEEVLKRDPDNVSGLTGLAAYNVQSIAMFLAPDPEPRAARAEALLERAIEKNPLAMMAYFYRGMLRKTVARPHDALADFAKVLELNPSYAPAHAQVGHVLSRIGRLDEALEHVRYAIRLSPKDHALGIWSLFGGQIELERGRDEAALEWLSRAVALHPRSPFAQASLAAAYALRGDHENAARHAAEARAIAPELTYDRMIERLVGLSEPGSEPRRLIEGLRRVFANPA